jgi:hypothetical protein
LRRNGQGSDHICMIVFPAHWRAIFAVQSYVKKASPEFLGHLSLQLQAFDHPRFDTTIVVTNWQQACSSLSPQEYVARVHLHKPLSAR